MAQRAGATVVVTGFSRFPGVADNPSQIVVEALRAAPGLLPKGAQCRLLEVAYAVVGPALEAILARPPAALVLTGYSALAEGLKLERRTKNRCAPSLPDARGFRPLPGLADPIATRENRACEIAALHRALRAQRIACTVSDDAGQYVCNHTYHTALAQIAARRLPTRAIFVHLPAIIGTPLAATSASAMAVPDMAAGVATIARLLAGEPTATPASG